MDETDCRRLSVIITRSSLRVFLLKNAIAFFNKMYRELYYHQLLDTILIVKLSHYYLKSLEETKSLIICG